MDNVKQKRLAIILVTAIIVVDQIIKVLVKTHMTIGQDIMLIGEWCRLHFIENKGFAFGMAFGGMAGKIILTLFRVVASGWIIWYLGRLLKKNGVRTMFVISMALILAGALGNIIDSCFYGLVFDKSGPYDVATLFSAQGGYAPFFQGKVVDMFYFPLFEFDWPSWIPFVGGDHFEFFSAIFNFADASITIGVILLIIELVFFYDKDAMNVWDKKISERK